MAKPGVDSAHAISNPATHALRMRASLKHGSLIAQLPVLAQSPCVVRARPAADRGAVGRALAATRAFCQQAELGRDAAERLVIVVEEWVANVVEHGAPPPGSRIGLRLVQGSGAIRITMTDAGRPFDPRQEAFKGPNLERGGGAGLELLRAWSRVAAYGSRAGRNRLVLQMPYRNEGGGGHNPPPPV
ncbi:ATP-binding protein [Phenylobacterium sp. RIFCSPHIGHO2_01_FULL_69_31]|uniref:ATP-binding protein n=1 Tax=Phenylobacterium sp. RIFCSPHIGHO2_01_FULL_69_31 TaxID=1801944 RepID=UPI0025E14EB4|nr:ATP-binding protein [Phenylobacterium sp. RIFCSPHIGHO2_01_FULL_69_31]